jgi:hypothetical protein
LTSDCNGFKWSNECICSLFYKGNDDELDIDALDGYAKTIRRLHPKLEGEPSECFCGDICKLEVLGDYKTLWQLYWMCDNLAYDPEPGDMEVLYNNYFKYLQHLYL